MTQEPSYMALVKHYRADISATPALRSLLYDVDLLPEQIISHRGAVCMAAIVEAYRAGRSDSVRAMSKED